MDGTSLICLSCHDGTVALEHYGGTTTGTTLMGSLNAAADLTNDLSDDHPVGMTYDLADGELNALTDPFGTLTIADVLGGGTRVECSSCHDVHDFGYGSSNPFLLRLDNSTSGLCLACHAK